MLLEVNVILKIYRKIKERKPILINLERTLKLLLKKMFLEIYQNSQENNCARVS